MVVLAIDPGYEQSAWMFYSCFAKKPLRFGIDLNASLLGWLKDQGKAEHMAIEMVESFGMAVGKEVFETVWWIGRFCEAFRGPHTRIYRRQVKTHLCKSAKATDANIRQALIDRHGPGKDAAVGVKKSPGPLFGISKDVWSALAIAETWAELHNASEAYVSPAEFAPRGATVGG